MSVYRHSFRAPVGQPTGAGEGRFMRITLPMPRDEGLRDSLLSALPQAIDRPAPTPAIPTRPDGQPIYRTKQSLGSRRTRALALARALPRQIGWMTIADMMDTPAVSAATPNDRAPRRIYELLQWMRKQGWAESRRAIQAGKKVTEWKLTEEGKRNAQMVL